MVLVLVFGVEGYFNFFLFGKVSLFYARRVFSVFEFWV